MPHDSLPADDDDQRWLDLLAGREVADAGQRLREEAAWLRAALLAYRAEAPAGRMPDPADRVQRLLRRAVDAGVLQPPAPSAAHEPSWLGSWFARLAAPAWRWPAGAAIALALGLLAVAPLLEQAEPEGGTMRGDVALQTLAAPQPGVARDRLLAELRAAGIDAAPYERLGRAGIDAELVQPLSPAIVALLQRYGLRPPAGPQLRIEFVAQSRR